VLHTSIYDIMNNEFTNSVSKMCYIDGQKNKYSVLNECNRMLKYNIFKDLISSICKYSNFHCRIIETIEFDYVKVT
jgi:hypothetical protein